MRTSEEKETREVASPDGVFKGPLSEDKAKQKYALMALMKRSNCHVHSFYRFPHRPVMHWPSGAVWQVLGSPRLNPTSHFKDRLGHLLTAMGKVEPQSWLETYQEALKDDWLAENSESREEDVTRQQLEARIAEAEKAAASVEDPTKLLDLAEAYGVLNPREQRCLETCELVMKFALPFLNRRRQGDANQLQGRCLFLQNDFEGALRAVLRAQARAEAGEAVAQAWLSAKTEASGSCKGLLLDLYARQSPKAMPHALRLGQPTPRPSSAPLPAVPPVLPGVREAAMPRKRVHPTAAPLAQVNEEHRRPLEEALRVASRYSTELSSPGAALMVPQLVALVLQRHEHETLKRVVTTWVELKGWTESRALDAGQLTASDVALFVQDSRAPSRVIPSLQFLSKNLYLKLDLTLATALQKATKSAIGIGQHQAPVVQPILLARLEEAIANAIVTDNDKWLGLFGNWCVAMGCVRWAHIQRSRLLQMIQYSMIWECMRGKQRLRRCGFYWSCPRYSVFDGHDFGQAFVNVAEALPSDFAAIAFQLCDHAEIPHRVAKSQVALALSDEVEPDDLRRITSKSWRQLSVTWSFLSELDPTQVCALGNWLDTTEKGVNITPWRYHRGKQQQAQSLKLLLRLCLRSLVVDFKCSSWHTISPALAKQVLESQRPMLPDEDTTVVFEQVSTKKLVTEQVVRLRNQVKTNTFLINLKHSRGASSSSSELAESPAMDSTAPAGERLEPSDRVPVKARPPLPVQRPALLGSLPRPVLRPAALPPGVRPAGGARIPVPEPKYPPRRGGVPEPARPPRSAPVQSSSSVRLPGYAVHDRPRVFNPDEYFDELARNLPARVQHSGDPAPPTIIHNYKEDRLIPAIILGPLPKASMAMFFKEHNVKMVITAFEESLTSRGGSVPEGVCTFQLPLTHYDRDKASVLQAWQYIRKSILPTLEAGESVYIHCMAGVHRAPLAAAAITAMLTKTSFDDQLARIGTLRRIEPHKVIKKPSMKMAMWWLRDLANRQTFQSVLIQLPVVLARSDTPTGGWHVLTTRGSGEPPQPSCRWRQSPGNRKAFFTGGVVTAESVEEALVHERRWCRQCIENLPASFQGVLSNSAFELLK
eukprot:s845_g12.t1